MFLVVTKRPDGSAPRKIRNAWINLILEADDFPVIVPVKDSSGKIVKERNCWKVPFSHALCILGTKSKEAADWYRQNYPKETQFIAFGCDETRVIDWSPK
jgi:hypothetical protein